MKLTDSTPGHRDAHCHFSRLALLLAVCLLLAGTPSRAADSMAEPVDDVRVLIDISGSMKRTDPHNLRRPALRLFTSLLPKGAHAGVWTFGQWTNMLVKHGQVDTPWKNNARKSAGGINSRGLYTNIEDVLRRATWDWKRPDAGHRRSLILLTDGLVDISKNPAEDTASRERILNDVLPRLQQAGITVHTIALSSESDAPLLQQLAAATGGWFETIESADGLERLFLRMFEKVSKADTLPLEDNRVNIDNSIHEATFLVFRKPDAGTTTITAPDGGSFDRQQLPAGVEWFEDERYELITVQNPPPGEWRINADVDPDNRVMVVTDLRMKNTELPNDLSVGRPLLFTMQLEQRGKIIDRPDFLQFVKVTLTQVSANGDEWQWRLRDDGKHADLTANDGIFSTRLGESLIEGEHAFILDVDGITFKRNKHQQVKVYGQPVDAHIEALGHDRFALIIVPYVSLIDPHSMHIDIEHVLPNGRLEKAEATQVSTVEWRLELDASGSTGEHELTAHIRGQRSDGSPVNVQLGPIHFATGGDATPHERTPMRAPQPEQHEAPAHEPPVAEHQPPPVHHEAEPAAEKPKLEQPVEDSGHAAEEDEHPPQIGWGMIIGSIVGLTVLIGGLVFGGIKLWPKIQAMRKRKEEGSAKEEKKEEPPVAAATAAAPAPEAEEAEEAEPDTGVPDVDQAIDELLGDSTPQETPRETETAELDPELDLSADDGEEPAEVKEVTEMDAVEEPQKTATQETVSKEAEEIAEIPEDLISLDDDNKDNKKA
ncbi:MAG TPA: VWA domain-containing protein [Gammaproteobacteria bacterium]|nr:VWA domain-containing protein [Gammaproteobacteria bacterium]